VVAAEAFPAVPLGVEVDEFAVVSFVLVGQAFGGVEFGAEEGVGVGRTPVHVPLVEVFVVEQGRVPGADQRRQAGHPAVVEFEAARGRGGGVEDGLLGKVGLEQEHGVFGRQGAGATMSSIGQRVGVTNCHRTRSLECHQPPAMVRNR
jgi:hypothetical protein